MKQRVSYNIACSTRLSVSYRRTGERNGRHKLARARTPDRDIDKRYPVQTPPAQSLSLVPTHHRRLILIRRHIPTPSSIRARACPRIDAYGSAVGQLQSQVRAATSGLTRTPSVRQLCCPKFMTSSTSTRSPCGQFCQCTPYVDRQGGSTAASLSLLYNYKRVYLLCKYLFYSNVYEGLLDAVVLACVNMCVPRTTSSRIFECGLRPGPAAGRD